jgi:hypothetical protein
MAERGWWRKLLKGKSKISEQGLGEGQISEEGAGDGGLVNVLAIERSAKATLALILTGFFGIPAIGVPGPELLGPELW